MARRLVATPLAVLLVALTSGPATAQEALVLGGGGARGLAHAGVVVGFDRLGYDPDLVVGTSMGAIIGALYAANYPPEVIWRNIESIDWQQIFMPRGLVLGPGRQVRHPALTYALESRGVGSAGGVVADWRINRLLAQLLFDANARARGDFDRLARRFRAVAADLDTGAEVVLAQGDLARAVRASMSVPGFFSPVAWRGRVLVDGGIANNLPVSVARALGAEYIVAVNPIRPGPLVDTDKPFDVGLRGVRLLINNAVPTTPRPDVLLEPDLEDVAEFAFPADPTPLLRAGLAAALATKAGAWHEAHDAPVTRSLPAAPDSLGALVIDSVGPGLTALAREAFAGIAPGPYTPQAVIEAMNRLYATGLFDGVWPAVVDSVFDGGWPAVADSTPDSGAPTGTAGERMPRATGGSGAPVLRVRLVPAPRLAVAGAVGYDNDRGGRAWSALTLRVARAAPLTLTVAGSINDLEGWSAVSLLRHSLRWPSLAWSAGAYYREADVRDFVGDAIVDESEIRRAGGWLGLEAARVAPERVASAVIRAEHVRVDDGESGLSVGPLVRLSAAAPPTQPVGVPGMLETELRFGAVHYARARVRGSLEGSLGPLRLAAVGDLAVASASTPADALPALGDAHAIPGFRWGEERGRVRVVGGADVAHRIPLGGWARLRLRTGAIADGVSDFGGSEAWVSGAELGALWTTPLGTILAAVGANTRGRWRIDLSAGPPF